jgi:hypothetical protein
MASTITAGNATNGLALSCDNTGILELKTGTGAGTTALTIGTGQEVAFTLGSAAAPSITFSGDTNTGIFSPAADTIAFSEGGVESGRFDSSGNLLVGTTGVDPIGDGVSGQTFGASTTPCRINKSSGTALALGRYTSTGNYQEFYYNKSITGAISTNGSTTTYSTSSDYRLKDDIQPMTGALAKVAALKPCTYKWKADGEASQGFIAHELAEVVPECVTGEKDAVNEDGSIKPQGIDTSFLVATLTAGLQEAVAMIEELKAKVAALEGAA